MSEYTHGSIVPLIGGEPLGLQSAMGGKNPEWVVSYSPFLKNDSHYINYLKEKRDWDGDYVLLDQDEQYRAKPVDIVSAVCPCAGLSSLSVTSSEDSSMNDWMYVSTEYVLEKVRPRVFFGENAPRLFTKKGEKVAKRLHEIGLKNGYSLTLYSTSSRTHGLSQKRPRTFYFFTKGTESTPYFKTFHRDLIHPVEEILSKKRGLLVNEPDDPMLELINKSNPYDNPWLKYALYKTESSNLMDLYNKIERTENLIVFSERLSDRNLNEVADWFDSHSTDVIPEKYGIRARAMQAKLNENKGYWAHGISVPKQIIPALIGVQPSGIINPFSETFLTLRDALDIMTMPEDFSLSFDSSNESPVKYTNHICQNVPHDVARDIGEAIIEYLKGEDGEIDGRNRHEPNTSFLRQKNEQKSLSSSTESLQDFFLFSK